MQLVQTSKWGNSLAFRIPKGIAETLKLEAGGNMEMTTENGALILRKPKAVPEYRLEDILGSFTTTEQIPELSWGKPAGDEAW